MCRVICKSILLLITARPSQPRLRLIFPAYLGTSINMIRLKVIPVIFILLTGIIFFSCRNDKIEGSPCNSSVPASVSFSGNLLPIFRAYCSIPGCHSGGSPTGNLNLEDPVAYSQLLHPGSGYVDTLNPSFSVVYIQMTSSSQPMPPTGKLEACKIEMVLRWIQQGARNN